MAGGTNNLDAKYLFESLVSRRKHLLSMRFKKLVRSIQVLFPSFPDKKFALHEWFYRKTHRLFKKDFGGLYLFSESWRGKLLLDIGANRGQSIVAFQNSVPDCRIVAFEANQQQAAKLAARYAGDAKVSIECCALTSISGTLKLYIPTYRGFLFDSLSSLKRSEAVEWFNKGRFYWFDPNKVTIEESEVPARTLDSCNLAPVFMKLSIQRGELELLRGATETLAMHRPAILCAYPWPELIEFLVGRGYRPCAYKKNRFIPGQLGLEFTWFLVDQPPQREVVPLRDTAG